MEDIRDYIAKDSPFYAKRFIGRIFDHVEKLVDFPKIGRLVPEADNRDDIRELIFRGYRIVYLLTETQAEVVTVIHGSRDLSKQDDKPWDEK